MNKVSVVKLFSSNFILPNIFAQKYYIIYGFLWEILLQFLWHYFWNLIKNNFIVFSKKNLLYIKKLIRWNKRSISILYLINPTWETLYDNISLFITLILSDEFCTANKWFYWQIYLKIRYSTTAFQGVPEKIVIFWNGYF